MHIDPYILAFSAVTVVATIFMGFWSARKSKTASDFFVAGRSVSVGWNASAISGEYLSAASFMGVAGMVMSSGYDALWYPVCYACGYLFLLLFIAGPLRRFGAYTIPDFAEGRFDSPVFRKIAVVFVLFIGFFYTMPQMKGAGTTLAYIFPGLPYWAGVVLVGAVITLNVALGGMKGITLVQAFQYWAKMFAISVPIFVLMTVYGHYGKQVGVNHRSAGNTTTLDQNFGFIPVRTNSGLAGKSFSEMIRSVQADPAEQPKAEPYYTNGLPGIIATGDVPLRHVLQLYERAFGKRALVAEDVEDVGITFKEYTTNYSSPDAAFATGLARNGIALIESKEGIVFAVPAATEPLARRYLAAAGLNIISTSPLPAKAPADATWLNPFGPLTTKAAKSAKPAKINYLGPVRGFSSGSVHNYDAEPAILRLFLSRRSLKHSVRGGSRPTPEWIVVYAGALLSTEGAGDHSFSVEISPVLSDQSLDLSFPGKVNDRRLATLLQHALETNGIGVIRSSNNVFTAFPLKEATVLPLNPRPYALLYTYSLIIALVCGTAGLPHILVRFYTNPDGVAAKRTTMWVMILIGVFYVFPPVFGVMGRNLLPSLYEGVGAKGTDKVVLELPRILNEGAGERESGGVGTNMSAASSSPPRSLTPPLPDSLQEKRKKFPWGSILSGITCAGAFAAFMSTFSGLLVSMTGAMAHDVYGRMLNPKATPQQRLRAFKIAAVGIGAVAIGLGMQVEPLQINFMVGQAFAIAAASYFPLLFVSVWWRKLTMKGAATGMLTGGTLALAGISLTSFSDLKWLPLDAYWAAHPLLRILCEQPAIWTVPLAITLMVVVSKLTATEVPADIRMKMLVLHAPEKLGLKQEYIQEHQHGH